MMARQTHYTVLRIPEDADPDRIRHAFRTLARQYHPDAGSGSSAEKFRAVVEAHDVLSDPQRRRRYDAALARSRSRNVVPSQTGSVYVAEPLIPTASRPESLFMRSRRVAVANDPFDVLDETLDELFGRLNSQFAFRRW